MAVLAETARRWISERRHAGRVGLVEGAVMRAAGLVVEQMLRDPGKPAAVDRMVREGAAYVAGAYPDTVRKLGITEDRLAEMVRGELGRLRAAVKIGGT